MTIHNKLLQIMQQIAVTRAQMTKTALWLILVLAELMNANGKVGWLVGWLVQYG